MLQNNRIAKANFQQKLSFNIKVRNYVVIFKWSFNCIFQSACFSYTLSHSITIKANWCSRSPAFDTVIRKLHSLHFHECLKKKNKKYAAIGLIYNNANKKFDSECIINKLFCKRVSSFTI